jgi:primosomal protein N' (replication factor Y)
MTGPAPCAIDRIRGRWRWHFLLRSARATPLTAIGAAIQDSYKPPASGDNRVIIDRDPISLL